MKNKAKQRQFVMERTPDGCGPTFAVVDVRTAEDDLVEIVEAIKRAVAAWINNHSEGAELWRDSGRDLNIGDLASVVNPIDGELQDALRAEGIEALDIEIHHSTAPVVVFPYDEVLVNRDELDI